MSVRSLVSAIEADPVKQEASYTLMKEALLGSYRKTKWQMAYPLLDHPDLGDCRPSAMMAEMLALRFETTAPDSLFLALFLRRLPAAIKDHLAAANHTTATEMAAHVDIFWDARNTSLSPLLPSHPPPFQFAPLRLGRAALLTAAPGCPIPPRRQTSAAPPPNTWTPGQQG